jgi:hypothetical protein
VAEVTWDYVSRNPDYLDTVSWVLSWVNHLVLIIWSASFHFLICTVCP